MANCRASSLQILILISNFRFLIFDFQVTNLPVSCGPLQIVVKTIIQYPTIGEELHLPY